MNTKIILTAILIVTGTVTALVPILQHINAVMCQMPKEGEFCSPHHYSGFYTKQQSLNKLGDNQTKIKLPDNNTGQTAGGSSGGTD